MNLALRSNVPIYVERKVFEEANRAIKAAGFLH
jgi:bifunctional DNase/RNase